MRIVDPMSFPFVWYNALVGYQKRKQGNQGNKQQLEYKDLVTAFDIETSRLPDIEQSVMYIWQWAFGDQYCVVGRTWDEFLWFADKLSEHMTAKQRLVVWVHNLSFEFAFLRGIHRFMPEDVFALKSRKILRADMGNFEFRCSYLHCNMSLDEYLKKMQVEHKKISGFDYGKIRYPWTELTAAEVEYCVHDVIGLVEALTVEMRHEGDNLYTIPATSTGYVRRDAKRAMRNVSYNLVHNQLPELDVFYMLREAFRGGDTHANRFFSGQIVNNVHSVDRSSSYPDIQCNCLFPMGPFYHVKGRQTFQQVMDLIVLREKAVIMRCAISGLHLLDAQYPAPYISRDKCRNIIGGQWDNGRVLCAEYLETTLTDVDLRIVAREYGWSDIVFYDVAYSRYQPLPGALVAETIQYYKAKTELKGVAGEEVQYTKSKNKLNSIYGMMAQNPLRRKIVYTQDGKPDKYGTLDYYPEDDSLTDSEILDKHNKRAFLCYQWGCWVTAWARYRLRQGIWNVLEQGGEFLYCDTDSVKYIGDVSWDEFNHARIVDSMRSGAFAVDPAGITHYMGVFESEHDMTHFRTWGAKKYAFIELDKQGRAWLRTTIAGVGKYAGARELMRAGIVVEKKRLGRNLTHKEIRERGALLGLLQFKPGFVFREAGGLEAVYNDDVYMVIEREGHKLEITPNVTLRPGSYTLGLAGDYERLLLNYRNSIDI